MNMNPIMSRCFSVSSSQSPLPSSSPSAPRSTSHYTSVLNRDSPCLSGLKFHVVSATPDQVIGSLVVSEQHVTRHGILHGGINAIMAEEVASVASMLNVNYSDGQRAVGTTLAASHIGSAKTGDIITAIAKPLHRGKTTQLWDIVIQKASPENKNLSKTISLCRVTCQVVNRQS